jgi:S-DNA-T family DNA segregation ATPase FtsK/SpoIIIE
MIVLSFLILLSLVSYTARDEAIVDLKFSQVVKVIIGDKSIQANRDLAQNWLGLIGALIANFFINSTIGYFSLVFPLILLAWSWGILRKRNFKRLIYFTNYFLVASVLLATVVGLLRLVSWMPQFGTEWSGSMGDFLANVFSTLLGVVGGLIVVVTVLFVVLVLSIDLDPRVTFGRIWGFFRGVAARIGEERADRNEAKLKRKREELIGRRAREEKENGEEHEKERVLIGRTGPVVAEPRINRDTESLIPTWQDQRKGTSAEKANGKGGQNLQMPSRQPLTEESSSTRVAAKPVNVTVKTKALDIEKPVVVKGQVEEILEDYALPSLELLDMPKRDDHVDDEELNETAKLLQDKLANFDIEIDNISVTPGPVVTLYELVPASTVRISKIVGLADDIALALQARGIRILAPIPGKGAVGVEIPNQHPSIVNIRTVIGSSKFRDAKLTLPIAIGKTISGDVYCDDLSKMPHLLIAGTTGSGKSVGINTILASLLYKLLPSDVKFVIIDPKKIELSLYSLLRNHFIAVSPDVGEEIITTAGNAVLVLKSVEYEMERRYDILAKAGVRSISDYNERISSGRLRTARSHVDKGASDSGKDTSEILNQKMPYLIVVIDELADLMLTAAKEVEEPIARLAQLARAVGIHLVVATQRPSVDVITGVIKANFSARIAYQVATKIDSRTILDFNGAEQLLGNGDMLYLASGSPKPIRIQNAFISTDEVERVVSYISKQRGYSKPFQLPSAVGRKRGGFGGNGNGERDELFEDAARLIVRHQQGSVSLLQRRLKVGYSRAARLVDELEAAGIVGPFDGSKAREVLVENEQDLLTILQHSDDSLSGPPADEEY